MTDVIQWDDSYAIGVPQIDSQHQRLVGMIARLQRAVVKGDPGEEEGQVIKALVDYTRYHFTQEQVIMQRIGFEDMERHKQLHRRMAVKIAELLKELRSGKETVTPELLDYLYNWLMNHILTEDKKIAEAMRVQEQASAKPVMR